MLNDSAIDCENENKTEKPDANNFNSITIAICV